MTASFKEAAGMMAVVARGIAAADKVSPHPGGGGVCELRPPHPTKRDFGKPLFEGCRRRRRRRESCTHTHTHTTPDAQ